jgi:hypothetical protein
MRFTTGMMLDTPVPLIGVRGIRFVARKIRKLERAPARDARLFLGHLVRMQEEIGTGGAGFRFLYAAFLQEASRVLARPELDELSREFTAAGDEWRQFALSAAMICKDRRTADFAGLGDHLARCATMERAVLLRLRSAMRN